MLCKYTDPLTSAFLRAHLWAKPLVPTALVSDTITTKWDQTLQQKTSVLSVSLTYFPPPPFLRLDISCMLFSASYLASLHTFMLIFKSM